MRSWRNLVFRMPPISVRLLAVAALLLSGCALVPSGTITVREHPSPSASPTGQPLPTNSWVMSGDNLFGMLAGPSVRVSCGAGGHSVEVRGEVQGALVAIDLTHLSPGQDLYNPPISGGFSDAITMTVTGPGSSAAVEYVAGNQGGSYQGVGTLVVNKGGRGGTVSMEFGPAVGQEPSVQSSGGITTFGANSGSVTGSWRCP